jgi:hypothetical protein
LDQLTTAFQLNGIYVECRAAVGPKDTPERFAERRAGILFKALFQNVLRGLDKAASMFTAYLQIC